MFEIISFNYCDNLFEIKSVELASGERLSLETLLRYLNIDYRFYYYLPKRSKKHLYLIEPCDSNGRRSIHTKNYILSGLDPLLQLVQDAPALMV